MKKTDDLEYQKSIHRQTLDGPLRGSARMKIPFKPTPANPLILSTSELGDFLRCRLRWNWRYRVGLRRRTVGMEQGVGLLVHQAREVWYREAPKDRTIKRMEKIIQKLLFKSELTLSEDDRRKMHALAKAMSAGYAEWVLSKHDRSDAAIGLRQATAHTEDFFSFPLAKDGSVLYRGKMDLRYEPTSLKKTLAGEEAKTRGQISFDMLDLSDQLSAYLANLRHNHPGYKRYIMWRTVLRRQLPGPRVKAALFARESIERTDEEIEVWLRDTRRKAMDILDAAIYPTQTDRCAWDCDFYKLCVLRAGATKQDKEDFEDTLNSEYERK